MENSNDLFKETKKKNFEGLFENIVFDEQDFLLFVISLDDLKIERTNQKANKFFGHHIKRLQEDGNFYKEIIHPKKYLEFITHLKSCQNLLEWEEKEIKVPVKTASGEWKEFYFKHRLFNGSIGKKEKLVLSIATEILKEEKEEGISFSHPQKNREKYRSILESIDVGYCIIEMIFDLNEVPVDYLFLEANPAFQEHTKIKLPVGRAMREVNPNHEDHWFETYGKVATTGKAVRFQNYAEKLNQSWFDVDASSIGNAENKQVVLLFSNITDQKQTQDQLKEVNNLLEEKVEQRTQELKENTALLQTIFDTTNEGIIVFKPIYNKKNEPIDFEYFKVNKVITEQYKMDLVGKRYLEINPDAVEIGVFDALKRTLTTGNPEDFEIKYHKEPYYNWFRITAKRQNNLLITTLEDITQRKIETRRLKQTVQFKRQLAQTSPDIIMIFNLYKEKVRYVNKGLGLQPGMGKNDILDMPLLDIVPFIHPRDREKGMDFHLDLVKAKDDDINEIEFRLKTGNKKWEWFNARGKVFMRTKKGNVCEYMILLHNIEEQKATHKALLHAEKLSIKGEVASTIAHELRNPIASIGMAADILKKKTSKNNNNGLENYIGIIRRSSKILNNLVTDLLSSSSYSTISLKKTCLAKTLEDTLQLANDRIYLSGIKVVKNYQGNYFINADSEKLKTALLNLIVNASEAMDPENGILTLSIEKLKDEYLLSIADNGCGVEKEQLDKLFEAYYTQRKHGLGIGLSSVKNILEDHDAKIDVNSEPNKGTTFRLYFHCHEPQANP